MSCALAIGASYGICSIFALKFSPMHNFIPFLILGLGIDDMFVIIQAWTNMEEEKERKKANFKAMKTFSPVIDKEKDEASFQCKSDQMQDELEHLAGLCMERSGVSISVTSLTDFLAFAVGATTVLPALRSFCIFCGVGILIVYMLQSTWFVAWLVMDQKRISENRNGFMPFIKHKPVTVVNEDSKCRGLDQMKFLQDGFIKYSNFLMKTPMKIIAIMSTLILFSIGLWGNSLLIQKFDPMWFLPLDSYLVSWHDANEKYFPSNGEKIFVFVTELQLPEELEKLDSVISELQKQDDILSNVNSWYVPFKKYHNDHFKQKDKVNVNDLDEELFKTRLTQFLFSPNGSRFRMLFRFDGNMKCGIPAPEIQVCFSHL